jgi:diguanylate cyclase (GGDEF)-like protein
MNATEKMLEVLAVEDSEDDFELIRHKLVEDGFTVTHERVETAEALTAALQRKPWDVVICDHNLPALDSLSALNIVQKTVEGMPFIIVSGLISDEVAVVAMRRGARDFIRKDNLSRLAPAIERELRQAEVHIKLEQVLENLFHVSNFDSLTGLPNCEYLFAHFKAMTSREEYAHPFAVFLIDLDRFRKITNALGVLTGDKVLFEAAGRLRTALGAGDFIARFGNDRFVAVVPHLKQEARARDVASAIHQCLNEVFQVDGQELFVKASVGVSFYPENGQEWSELFRKAESALYGAKAELGSSYQAYSPEMDILGKERLAMETALYRALEKKQFVLHYQPQIDLPSDRIVGAEALIRWQHPELGMISPGEFIPLLEETGLIVAVGEWVLRTACTQNQQWQNAGLPPIRIAVNLSAVQFRQSCLTQTIREVLKETGLAPEYLELEITENIAIHTEKKVIDVLDELRTIGIQIAIDDFGTGYSSLGYLKRLPIDKLKIDQSFVRDCKDDINGGGIVMAIIGMGHSLKLKVIAEGVETLIQADFLKLHGCDEAQGYYYGKPMEGRDLALLIERSAASARADRVSCV